jgi:pilus assembly protein CpaC
MVDGIRKLLGIALAACLAGGLSGGHDQAWAQAEPAVQPAPAEPTGSVLRLARGLASDNITVLIGRAIVVESTQPFIEVSVADPAVADVSPLSDRTIYIFGKARGATSLTLLGENGALITNVTVKVIPDLAELKAHLKTMLPNEPIDVRLSGGGVVLSGVVSGKAKVTRAMELARAYVGDGAINMMTVGGTQQVMLKVRIAEMSRNASKELGFNTALSYASGDVGAIFASGATANTTNVGVTSAGVGTASFDINPVAISTSPFGTIGTVAKLGDFVIGALMDSLESKGFSRTLAEPNLVALSGTQAKFLAGQDVPIPVVEDEDVEIQFKEVGVGLNFIPTVLDDDLINIALSAEVSSISSTAGVPFPGTDELFPTFPTRRATTTIELKDGESFAIAGLLEDNFTDQLDQFPWLGDIPVLGALFRSSNFARGESELVVIVTAHLVTPVSEAELSLPIDHVRIPNEMELFLLGQTEATGAPGLVQSQGFDGQFGYVVE